MSDHDELVSQFIEISGSDDNVARFYLSSSNWSLEDALSNFLGNHGDAEINDPLPSLITEHTPVPLGQVKTVNSSEYFAKNEQNPKPKFATLKDVASKNKDDDEEEGQAFYAGGSDRSGQQVLGPPKRKMFREQLTEMFRMAQQSSAFIENLPTPSTSSTSNWGQGIRLGMTDSDHTVVASTKKAGDDKKPVVVLKLWSQGFTVGDGELRSYDDPRNKEFLETVMRGEVPQELQDIGYVVNVDVEDHRSEDYKSRTTCTRDFKGSGHALGSPSPRLIDIPSNTSHGDNKKIIENSEGAAKENLKLDTSEPCTSIQVRLTDGSRLTAQFNFNHTVSDIENYVRTARPQYAARNFVLVTSFPTRELSDGTLTIDAAGLKNAALMQRLK